MEREHKEDKGQAAHRNREGSKQPHEGEYGKAILQDDTDEPHDSDALQFARDAEKYYKKEHSEQTKPSKQ